MFVSRVRALSIRRLQGHPLSQHSANPKGILSVAQRSLSSNNGESSSTTTSDKTMKRPPLTRMKRPTRDKKDPSKKKENFAKKYLEPAARGELAKDFSSGIPKLAGRKGKGHGMKDQFPYSGKKHRKKDIGKIMEDATRAMNDGTRGMGKIGSPKIGKNQYGDDDNSRVFQKAKAPQPDFEHLFREHTPEELDPLLNLDNPEWLGPKANIQTRFNQERKKPFNNRNQQESNVDLFGDPVDEEEQNSWKTDSFYVGYNFKHPESRREALPIIHPFHRVQPSRDFIQAHKAFIYASNIPHPILDDKLGSWDNPVHKHKVTEYVAEKFSVSPTDVFPATMNSAYIGFTSSKEASDFSIASDKNRQLSYKVEASSFSAGADDKSTASKEMKEFLAKAETLDCIVHLQNVPPGMTEEAIIQYLNDAIKDIEVPQVFFDSPTNVLLCFTSSGNASALLNNSKLHVSLWDMGHQKILFQPAHRAVVHSHFGGKGQSFPIKKTVDRLLVDGDIPSEDFFLSHAGVLHLENVPLTMTKKEISEYFQPYCMEKRDVEGSIEFVKSICGQVTGRAYIGFDLDMEVEAAFKDITESNKEIRLRNEGPFSRVKIVREDLKKGEKLGPRSYRSQEELWKSLRCWEEYVDPKDLEYFESKGIYKEVLEEAFIAARYHNPTYGVEDQARKGERLLKNKEPGQHYREFVQSYVKTLKEMIPTKENPGEPYKAMFMPDEEIHFDFLDQEEDRTRKLKQKYYPDE